MSRKRVLRVLFVRPSDAAGLDPALRFDIPREGGAVLPVGLLRLASAAKYASPHRVMVHDARLAAANDPRSSVRAVARVQRPDVAVVWLHPASLGDALEAARAVRHAGCSCVLGAGPLVRLAPDAAARLVELDGLLPASPDALNAALDVVAAGGRADELAEALATEGAVGVPLDRKLLDYAAYRGLPAPDIDVPPSPGRIGSDKGRFAASTVPLHACDGSPLRPAAVLEDARGCVLLGIKRLDLRADPLGQPQDAAFWQEVLAERIAPTVRVRATIAPAVLRGLALNELARSVDALDLGPVHAGDSEAVDDLRSAAGTCRRARLEVSATVLLGVHGYGDADEDRGIERLAESGLDLAFAVPARIGDDADPAWGDWLDAPSPNFVPPGIDPGRLDRARRLARSRPVRRRSRSGVSSLLRALRG